jgi:hypothetical protein
MIRLREVQAKQIHIVWLKFYRNYYLHLIGVLRASATQQSIGLND